MNNPRRSLASESPSVANRSLSYTNAPHIKRTVSGTRSRVVVLPPQETPPTSTQLRDLMFEDTQVDLPSLEISHSDILEEEYVLGENDIEEELLIVQEEWLEVAPVKTMPASMPPLPTEPPSPDTWLDESPTLPSSTPNGVPCLQVMYHRCPIQTDADLILSFGWSIVSYIMDGSEQYVCETYINDTIFQIWRTLDGFIGSPTYNQE